MKWKWNFFNSMSGQSFITAYMKYPETKLNVRVISLGPFWQILRYVNTTTKWNHMKANIGACKYKGNIFELLLWNSNCNQKCLVSKKQNIDLSAALQIVVGHWSLPTIWVSWSVKIDADFLKWPSIINM